MTALFAHKLSLRFAVGLRFVPALATGSRRAAWIDDPQVNACEDSLVRQKYAELEESPTGHFSSLLLAKPSAVTDILQVLACKAATAVFSDGNKLFRDAMIQIAPKARFSGRYGFEFAADILRPNLRLDFCGRGPLQRTPQAGVALPARFDIGAGMSRTIACGRDANMRSISCLIAEPKSSALEDILAFVEQKTTIGQARLVAVHQARYDTSHKA